MADLIDHNRWPKDIYRIQKTDYIQGGSDGVINIQPSQVADRTFFLKTQLEAEHNVDGSHRVENTQIADDAAIAESKLALDVPTQQLAQLEQQTRTSADKLLADVESSIGSTGLQVQGLSEIVRLNWRYSDFGFEFEFFRTDMTMRDLHNIHSHAAIAKDDSIDVDDTTNLIPGMRLLLADAEHCEEIEIRDVLERGRIRTTRDLQYTYNEPTQIGYTNWTITEGNAEVAEGQIYYSRLTNVLSASPLGRLLICREDNNSELVVQFRDSSSGNSDWQTVDCEQSFSDDYLDAGWHYDQYTISGTHIQLKITGASGIVNIRHMALFPVPMQQLASNVRTPNLLLPMRSNTFLKRPITVNRDFLDLEHDGFFTTCRDNFAQTEYGFFLDDALEPFYTLSSRELLPLYDIPEQELPPNGTYKIRCRHQSDMSEWSQWSKSVTITLEGIRILFGFVGAEKTTGFNEMRFYNLNEEKWRFGFDGAKRSKGFEAALFC